ncbi:MAG TPA: DUF1800 family protein [Cyclobacteriaceae bacterium]|nr:DUF1800 domain-containing protein [Cyclobacteriaceae bacterium]HRK54226.1 DUF1800 family protein [Cyclobacteriaceae bacterium]
MPLTELTTPLGPKRAAHLLHRASFGPTKDQVDLFATYTPAQAVNQLFGQTLPDPILPIDPETGTEWVLSGTTDVNSGDSDLQEFFKGWLIGQMMSTGIDANLSLAYSARERVVFFIHTVLTTIQSKVNNSRSLYFQNQLLRQFALDKTAVATINFKELTKKICVDNAMLRLLDGNLNVKGSPNENYARELHELYTIGRGLEGTLPPITDPGDYFLFKELDVQEAAKVLSGWEVDTTFSNIDPDTNLPRGKVRGSVTNASSHDNTAKQFSERFGNITIQPDPVLLNGTNPTEESALDEISQLIESIYAQPETARNICRRIYRYFVYHSIDTTLNDSVIQDMANTFTSNGFKLQPVLEELFKSTHFYEAAAGVDDDNFGGIIKSPLDLMVGTHRFYNIQLPDPIAAATEFYEKTNDMTRTISKMGMNFYEPFDVAGYDAYHQFPIYHRSWISTNYLTERYQFIRNLIGAQMAGEDIDVVSFVQNNFTNATASDARLLIIELAKYLLPVNDNLTFNPAADDTSGLTAERMNYFLTAFLKSPQIDTDPEGSWTFRWNNPVDMEVVTNQLKSLFNAMMQSPEYQLF